MALLSVALLLMLVLNNLGMQWKVDTLNYYNTLNLLCLCCAILTDWDSKNKKWLQIFCNDIHQEAALLSLSWPPYSLLLCSQPWDWDQLEVWLTDGWAAPGLLPPCGSFVTSLPVCLQRTLSQEALLIPTGLISPFILC